jgi:hypothetical protein
MVLNTPNPEWLGYKEQGYSVMERRTKELCVQRTEVGVPLCALGRCLSEGRGVMMDRSRETEI